MLRELNGLSELRPLWYQRVAQNPRRPVYLRCSNAPEHRVWFEFPRAREGEKHESDLYTSDPNDIIRCAGANVITVREQVMRAQGDYLATHQPLPGPVEQPPRPTGAPGEDLPGPGDPISPGDDTEVGIGPEATREVPPSMVGQDECPPSVHRAECPRAPGSPGREPARANRMLLGGGALIGLYVPFSGRTSFALVGAAVETMREFRTEWWLGGTASVQVSPDENPLQLRSMPGPTRMIAIDLRPALMRTWRVGGIALGASAGGAVGAVCVPGERSLDTNWGCWKVSLGGELGIDVRIAEIFSIRVVAEVRWFPTTNDPNWTLPDGMSLSLRLGGSGGIR